MNKEQEEYQSKQIKIAELNDMNPLLGNSPYVLIKYLDEGSEQYMIAIRGNVTGEAGIKVIGPWLKHDDLDHWSPIRIYLKIKGWIVSVEHEEDDSYHLLQDNLGEERHFICIQEEHIDLMFNAVIAKLNEVDPQALNKALFELKEEF